MKTQYSELHELWVFAVVLKAEVVCVCVRERERLRGKNSVASFIESRSCYQADNRTCTTYT